MTASLSDSDYQRVRDAAAAAGVSIMQWGGDVVRAALDHGPEESGQVSMLEERLVALQESWGRQGEQIRSLTAECDALRFHENALKETIESLKREVRTRDERIVQLDGEAFRLAGDVAAKDSLLDEVRTSRDLLVDQVALLNETLGKQTVSINELTQTINTGLLRQSAQEASQQAQEAFARPLLMEPPSAWESLKFWRRWT